MSFCLTAILSSKSILAIPKNTMNEINHFDIPNDTIILQLATLNLTQFQGQPVDTLLSHLPSGYTSMKIGGWRSQRLAEVLYVIYPNKVYVAIHVRNFQYMNPQLANTSTPEQNWDISQFRREAITFTIIFNDSVCINGCENRYK